MVYKNNVFPAGFNGVVLRSRMIMGAAMGLLLMTLFVFGVDNPDPAWGEYWRIRPLVFITIAGSIGGVFYYWLAELNGQSGWIKLVATLLGFFGYIVIIWLGSIAGLDGTLWN